MTDPLHRQTCYTPSAPVPPPVTVSAPEQIKGVHLRLEAQSAKALAMARIESEATAETVIEALLIHLESLPPQQKQAVYRTARQLAQQRKDQGLQKRRRTYAEGPGA